jgi:hypothetical protein
MIPVSHEAEIAGRTDTLFAMLLQRSACFFEGENLTEALKKKAYEHKDTAMIGRSHGIHATGDLHQDGTL